MKQRNADRPKDGYLPIHMPRNTGMGLILSGLALVLGFAMVWYIWWLAALSFAALVAASIAHTFNYNRDYYVPVDEVERTERGRQPLLVAGA
jgi:cytochrome o ubiquinol oxidase subunit 1